MTAGITEFDRKFIETKRKLRFIQICQTILHSNVDKDVYDAYDSLFTGYRKDILYNFPTVTISELELVIVKILNDADNGTYERYGVQHTPFVRLIAMMKEQDELHKKIKKLTGVSKYPYHRLVLKSYLIMFIDGHNDKIKNNQIRNLIHVYFSSLT